MLDFGWAELFLIMAVGVLVIGPNEIPALMRGLGRLFRRFQYMKHAFTQQFDEFMEAADVEDLQKSVNFESKPQGHEAFDEAAEDEDIVPAEKKAPSQKKPSQEEAQ
ncbi:MAG: twin-arginine translocase TatA/TatE family subunit [Pseudomonadota bacterium]